MTNVCRIMALLATLWGFGADSLLILRGPGRSKIYIRTFICMYIYIYMYMSICIFIYLQTSEQERESERERESLGFRV